MGIAIGWNLGEEIPLDWADTHVGTSLYMSYLTFEVLQFKFTRRSPLLQLPLVIKHFSAIQMQLHEKVKIVVFLGGTAEGSKLCLSAQNQRVSALMSLGKGYLEKCLQRRAQPSVFPPHTYVFSQETVEMG